MKDDGDVAGARSGCAGRRSAPSPSATSARRVLASSLAAKDCMRVQILEAALAEQLNRRITDENCTALGPKPSGAREDAAATGDVSKPEHSLPHHGPSAQFVSFQTKTRALGGLRE